MTTDFAAIRARLDEAISASERLGIRTIDARGVRERVAQRAGLPDDLYALALVGGTGVGKSSLLNALAGTPVSAVGARRPTTSIPVAWIPADRLEAARPLIDWLGQVDERPAQGAEVGQLLVLDLPDLDSIEPSHAARVDELLPRVDAVLWVTDLEKYQDAVLHDTYLHRWVGRLARQAIVINKIDRVGPADRERLRADLARQLRAEQAPTLTILLSSATSDIDEIRRWLADGEEAKRVVTDRLVASARAAIDDLAADAGVSSEEPPGPLIPVDRRAAAVDEITAEVLAVLDLSGLERQAVAATQLAARSRGGGPIGTARSVLERGSGMSEQRADPEGYLRRWRERGSLIRATNAFEQLVSSAIAAVPPRSRGGISRVSSDGQASQLLATAADRAIAGAFADRPSVPASATWPWFGILQTVALAGVVLSVLWLVVLWLTGGHPAPGTVQVPLLGPVPVPLVLLAGAVLAWWLLGRALGSMARSRGRRWSADLSERLRAEVRTAVAEQAIAPFDAFDEARMALWRARR